MPRFVLCAALLAAGLSLPGLRRTWPDPKDEASLARRRADLAHLLTALPPSPHWNAWLNCTGELPPDFANLPSQVDLPDPLIDEAGRAVGKAQWPGRRDELKRLLQHYVTGTLPPTPDNLEAKVIHEEKHGEVSVRDVLLSFGPGGRGRLHLQLLIPQGKSPLPVFISTFGKEAWVELAVQRGYLACLIAASDKRDDTEELANLYPDHDFTCLARRAWGVSRAIDYLFTLPVVNKKQIALSDHSRGGKMATWAAAFDERLGAVVGSSSVTGGSVPWRYCTDRYANETLEQITRNYPHWFQPRLRFFVGRENRLPVDMHEMVALIAPRAYMITLGTHESEVNPWGEERSFLAARRVYGLLGARDRLALRFRPGAHRAAPADIEAYFDWFDAMLGRKPGASPHRLLYGYSFEGWREATGAKIDISRFPRRGLDDLLVDEAGRPIATTAAWQRRRGALRQKLRRILGQAPARPAVEAAQGLASSRPGSHPRRVDDVERIIGRPPATDDIDCAGLSSAGFDGVLYYPRRAPADRELPVVILLHPYAHARGYSLLPITPDSAGRAAYLRASPPLDATGFLGTDFKIGTLTQQGCAVLTFDMIGFGSRLHEARDFYRRFPNWSLLGRMVDDVHAAVDVLEETRRVDKQRIFVMGHSLGGTVALFAAALDDRIAGACAVSGFTPLRLETREKGTGHLQDLGELHGLLPAAGFFRDDPGRLPWDYHEVLALIAPRPLLVVAPEHDQGATCADVKACVAEVRKVYELLDPEEKKRVAFQPLWSGQWRDDTKLRGRLRRLELYAPDDFNLLCPRLLAPVDYWVQLVLNEREPASSP